MRQNIPCLIWIWLALGWCAAAPGAARADWRSEFEAAAQAAFEASGSPGMAVVIVKDDAVILERGYGRLTSDPASPAVDADSVFLLGSTSKAFVAAQIAVLADQGALAFEDVVTRHAPWFSLADPWVTAAFRVDDLLTHRSGLPMFALTGMEVLDYPTADRLRGVRFIAPATSFRSAYAYQNVLYTAASKLVEDVTGQGWREHLATSIFTPLGMTRSVASQAAVDAMDNVAVGHLRLEDDSLWPVPSDWFWNQTQDRAMAAACVRTSARDLGRWLRFQLSPGKIGDIRVVTEANMRRMQAPHTPISAWSQGSPVSTHYGPVSYGMGWMRFDLSPQPFVFHEGGAMGSGSAVGFAPGAGVGIAVMSNVLAGDGLATELVWRFYELYFGPAAAEAGAGARAFLNAVRQTSRGVHEAVAAGTPARPLASYRGRYANAAYGLFTVRQAGEGLEIVMGPNRFAAALVPQGGDAFKAVLPGYPQGFTMSIPMHFSFPEHGPPVLTSGPILLDPAEIFVRVGEVPLSLLLADEAS
jgi:CubicO group peptidase (beta-lactamase class C family)